MVVKDLDRHVHLGAWTDWSRGPVLGRTLTISRFHGNLLIAFTAAFVAYVAVRFWRILCVALHRSYSTSEPRPTYYHQRQVILRNSPSPESGLWALLCLSYAWRRRGKVPIPRVFGVGVALSLTLFTIGAFGLAGVFSSSIASNMGNVVLLRGDKCGHTARSSLGVSDKSVDIANSRRMAGQVDTAFNYAQECYNTVGVGLVDCGRFVKPRLTWGADHNATCPFAEGMCYSRDRNLRLDTGHIDMAEHLGWNTPKTNSVSQRNVVTCAPLVTDDRFKSTYFDSDNNATLVRYHYGDYVTAISTNDTSHVPKVDGQHFTWQAPSVSDQYRPLRYNASPRLPNSNFGLMEVWSVTVNGKPDPTLSRFNPIPELFNSDSDVSIIFLSGNGVMSDQVVDDGWYRLTQPFTHEGSTYYQPEEAASPLACASQYQFCNLHMPGDAGCGPLASYTDAVYGAALKAFNATKEDLSKPATEAVVGNRDFDRLDWAITATSGTEYLNVVTYLGSRLLASQSALSNGIQNVDADNRPDWQLDVRNWFTTTLASIQASTLDTVVPSFDTSQDGILGSLWKGPVTSLQKDMCHSQTVRSNTHTSFSLFGIAFTYAMGAFVILLSGVLEPILHSLYKRFGWQEYREVEWNTNNALQLHRLAHEAMGYGCCDDDDEEKGRGSGWEQCGAEIPVTKPDVCLGPLDLTNAEHPVIMKKRGLIRGRGGSGASTLRDGGDSGEKNNNNNNNNNKSEEEKYRAGYSRVDVDSFRLSDTETRERGTSVEEEAILHGLHGAGYYDVPITG